MFDKRCVLTILLCLAAGWTSVGADVVLLEDFQNYTLGSLVQQTGLWHSSTVAFVEQELGNASNQILNHRLSAGQRDLYRTLAGAAVIGQTEIKTLFFRFRCENQFVDTGIGLTDINTPSGWDDFRVQIQINGGQLAVRHGTQTLAIQSLQTGVHAGVAWYNVWVVVNNSTNTYKVYLLQSNDANASATEAHRIVSGSIDTFNFRSATNNALTRFYVRANTNHRLWIDEIYMMDGLRLENPIALPSTRLFHDLIAGAQPGEVIELGAETYSLSETLLIENPITIIGQGRDETFIQASSNFQGDRLVHVNNTSDVRLADLTLDAMFHADIIAVLVLSNGNEYIVEDCRIRNIAAGGFSAGIYCSANVIDSHMVRNEIFNIDENSAWGAGIRIMTGSRGNRIDGNLIRNIGRGGILTTNGSGETTIVNNVVQNIGLLNPNPHDARIRLGIEVWNETLADTENNLNVIIEDNQVDHWISVDKHRDVSVRRNTVTGSQQDSGVGFAGIESVGSKNIVITDNVVEGGSHIGLSTSNDLVDDLVFVARNVFKNAVRFNAALQGTNTGPGEATRWYLYQNRFENAGEEGLRFAGPAYGMVLDSNEFVNNGGFGDAAIRIVQSSPWEDMDQFVIINNLFTGHYRTTRNSYPGDDMYWAGNTESNTFNNGFSSSGFPDGQPPLPVVSLSGNAIVGETLHFEVQNIIPEAVSGILWDMGAGLPLTGEQITFEYAQEGEYVVSAVVWYPWGWGVLAQVTLNVDEPLKADLNDDGIVNLLDFVPLSQQWMTDGNAEPSADLSGNNWVGLDDLFIFVNEWLNN